MKIERRIELIHRSAERMMEAHPLPRNPAWWKWMRKEAWLLLKHAMRLWQALKEKE